MSPHPPADPAPPSPTTASPHLEPVWTRRRRDLRRPGPWTLVTLMLLASALPTILGAAPALAAVPHESTTQAPASTDVAGVSPVNSWAWGVAANLTAALRYEGEYSGSQALTGSNLTEAGAYVDLDINADVAYAAYAIVNETAPSENGSVQVTVAAAQGAAETLYAVASGTFPAAGTYGPTSGISLVPMNVSLSAHLRVAQTFRAYLNYTEGANDSMALVNEHLHLSEDASVGLVAVNFPNVTASPSGTTTVSYTTGSLSATAQAEADLVGVFTPAVPLVEGPLALGHSWDASSTATFVGSSSWATQAQGVLSNGEGASTSNQGSSSLNATTPVDLLFTVTGVHTIYFADGANETDEVISNSPVFGEANGVTVEDGLFLLPANDGTQAVDSSVSEVAPEHPVSSGVSTDAQPPSAALVSSQHNLPDSEQATPVQGQTVEGSPMNAQQAPSVMDGIPAPTAPSGTPSTMTVFVEALLGFTAIGATVMVVLLVADRRLRPKVR